MRKRRYEILLPRMHNDGRPVSQEKFDVTQIELLEQFGALSTTLDAVAGIWTHRGKRYEDQSTRIVIDVEDTRENRQFFVRLQARLRKRFEQIEIYIASYPVDVL